MSEKDTFLNPYNFIPFPEKRTKHYKDEDVHTGVIIYTVTAKSPLFIPNTSSEHAFAIKAVDEQGRALDHRSCDFYSYAELEEGNDYSRIFTSPVIPGSELRGMVRGIYETLTGSCMGVLNADTYPVKRSGEVFKAALIRRQAGRDGRLALVEAQDCIYRESVNFKDRLFLRTDKEEGQQVFFRRIKRDRGKDLITDCSDRRDPDHPECGYLIKGMAGPETGRVEKQKHNCHVFVPAGRILEKDLDSSVIDRLRRVIASCQEQPTAEKNSYQEYQRNLESFLRSREEGYFPVYYSAVEKEGEKLLYLSPASITKEISHHSIGELAGEFKPCESRAHRCPACDLFGMTGTGNEEAASSRIRFADATAADGRQNSEYYDPIITLEALGGPRLSNTEFYLEKEEGADFWTYDYYTREGKAYPYRARLKGRKYYWHQPDKRLPAGIPRTELNKTVRPVKSGVTFEAKLYFDRVSARQPDQLLWILNGGNADEQPDQGPVAYKLGGGKPLGLGSVELKVKEVFHRRFVREEGRIRYLNEPETDLKIPRYQEAGFLPECREDFLTICALHAAQGKNVTYPIVPEQHGKPMEEGFKWFVRNHSGYDYKKQKKVGMPNARIQMRTLCALPRIQGVKTLPEEPALSGGSGDAQDRSRTQPGSAPAFGKVTGFNKNNTAAYILLDNGKRASVHFKEITFARAQYGKVDQTLPLGSRVQVNYEGRQDNGFDKWKCTGITK